MFFLKTRITEARSIVVAVTDGIPIRCSSELCFLSRHHCDIETPADLGMLEYDHYISQNALA